MTFEIWNLNVSDYKIVLCLKIEKLVLYGWMIAEVPALIKSDNEADTRGNPDHPKLIWGSFQPRGQTKVSHIAGRFFTSWATREAQEYWSG